MHFQVHEFSVTQSGRAARLVSLFALLMALMAVAPQSSNADPTTRIINGTLVPNSPTNWPFIVALVDGGDNQFCGGTLVTPTWVATAAHCGLVDGIIIGRKQLSDTGAGERIDVINQIEHESYNPVTFLNDIQLLQLDHAATGVTPLALASSSEDPPAGSTVSVAGWGVTEFSSGNTVDDLREAQIEVISNSTCSSAYGGGIAASMLCASHFDPVDPDNGINRDTCQGDSGGPLVVSTAGGPRLAGITSWGNDCALYPFPGVYTRVSSFQGWAHSIMTQHASFDVEQIYFGAKPVGSAALGQTVVVNSDGMLPVTLSGASVVGDPDFSLLADNCSGIGAVPSGSSCSLTVQYLPTTQGLATAQLKLGTNATFAPTISLDLSAHGALGAGATPVIAPKLSIQQAGKGTKLPRGKIKVVVKAYFIIPPGVNATTACTSKIMLSAKIPRVRKLVKTQGNLAWAGSRCSAKINLRLPRKARGKKVAFDLRFGGNGNLAAAEGQTTLRIK